MLSLPMVCKGEYDEYAILGVFEDKSDAQVFADKYNAEKGLSITDDARARVEGVRAFPKGDPGRSGHEIKVKYVDHRFNAGWAWSCTCGEGGGAGNEQFTREEAATHVKHWVGQAEQVALPQ
ncbi:hypothetical protein OOJ91_34000 [Micromonospora lupini]|uniref:hypothetical protein n=1 Tax=Micromonospora lupini TaxID=285679 RepID=UPI002259F64C|nr:hypothetical protein [Micromonospora lupini]MCX5070862.1 hypothetical protein [Micromonospora lupini]